MVKEDKIEKLKKELLSVFNNLKNEGLSSEDIIKLIRETAKIPEKEEIKVPLSVFKNDKLSSLEIFVKYLRENLLLSYNQIAELTGRNPATLAVTYNIARKKLPEKFVPEISPYSIPVKVLQDRKLSVLENISSYLKDTFGLNYHSVAVLLNRDDRTIWTVYQRAIKKKKWAQSK